MGVYHVWVHMAIVKISNFKSHFLFFYIFSVASQTKFFFFFFFFNLSFIYFISNQGWLCSYGVLACVQQGHQAWISGKIQRKNRQLRNYTELTQARPLMIGSLSLSLSLCYIYIYIYIYIIKDGEKLGKSQ